MILSQMKYGDYTWPHNPRVYEISYKRHIACHKVPFGLYIHQDMGRGQRIMRGEGEFCGEGAYEEFKKLATMFYLSEPKVLVHPLWQSAKAWFVSLNLKQEPRHDYVSYDFEFWECYEGYETRALPVILPQPEEGGGNEQQKKTYVIKRGDTLWGVANSMGMTLSRLLELNPQVRNPNLCYPEDIIYLN